MCFSIQSSNLKSPILDSLPPFMVEMVVGGWKLKLGLKITWHRRSLNNVHTMERLLIYSHVGLSCLTWWQDILHLRMQRKMINSTLYCAQIEMIFSGEPIHKIRKKVLNFSARISEAWSQACSSLTPLTGFQWQRSVLILGSQIN